MELRIFPYYTLAFTLVLPDSGAERDKKWWTAQGQLFHSRDRVDQFTRRAAGCKDKK